VFSLKERDFIENNDSYSKSYRYVMEHRIKKKLQQFYRLELPLIEQNQNLTEFHKNLTENNKLRTGSGPVTFTLPNLLMIDT